MTADHAINRRYCSDKLSVDYAHVGLYDASDDRVWIARKRFGVSPVRVSHARLLVGGTQDTSTADKDRFVCFWLHTPGTGSGFVHGYPIEWDEGHLMIRLDPNWDYAAKRYLPPIETRRVERNIEQQFAWGRRVFDAYVALRPGYPISLHMVGPRAKDSVFYVQRVEPAS